MKTHRISALLTLALVAAQLVASAQGILAVTASPAATPASYDDIVAKLKAQGLMDIGWTFHAAGVAQGGGIMSIGVYPNQAALDARLAKVTPVFLEAGLPAPAPKTYEIYRTFTAPLPAVIPANGILVHFAMTGMTTAQYGQTVARLINALGSNPPAGQLFHVAYKTPDGINVIDIWESPEAFQAFGGTLMPILQAAGVTPAQPTVYGLHNIVAPK